jgi:transposase
MSRRPRRRFSDVQKTKAVLAHVQDGVPVSQVCEDLGVHPNQYYDCQKQAFSGLPHVFSRDTIRQELSHQREVDNLKAKLSQFEVAFTNHEEITCTLIFSPIPAYISVQ